jgi:hypothetical protein
VQIVQDEDVFKAGANVHVCPYVGKVTGELRGKWVDAR